MSRDVQLLAIAKGISRKAGQETLILGEATRKLFCHPSRQPCICCNIFVMNPTALPSLPIASAAEKNAPRHFWMKSQESVRPSAGI